MEFPLNFQKGLGSWVRATCKSGPDFLYLSDVCLEDNWVIQRIHYFSKGVHVISHTSFYAKMVQAKFGVLL